METGLRLGYLGAVRPKGRIRQATPTATAPHSYSTDFRPNAYVGSGRWQDVFRTMDDYEVPSWAALAISVSLGYAQVASRFACATLATARGPRELAPMFAMIPCPRDLGRLETGVLLLRYRIHA